MKSVQVCIIDNAAMAEVNTTGPVAYPTTTFIVHSSSFTEHRAAVHVVAIPFILRDVPFGKFELNGGKPASGEVNGSAYSGDCHA